MASKSYNLFIQVEGNGQSMTDLTDSIGYELEYEWVNLCEMALGGNIRGAGIKFFKVP